jgi:hypothetical protein
MKLNDLQNSTEMADLAGGRQGVQLLNTERASGVAKFAIC